MIVVDSSVWIGWFGGASRLSVEQFDAMIALQEVLVGDVVLLEVLRGARDDNNARRIQSHITAFPVVRMLDLDVAIRAAANYRLLRSRGITIRSTIDMIIGTYCIEHGHSLLQSDRDFLPMAEHLGLKLV